MNGMTHSIGVLIKGSDDLTDSLTGASRALDAFGTSADDVAGKVNALSPSIDTSGIKKADKDMRAFGMGAAVAGGVVLAGLGVAAQSATAFGTAMSEVSTLVDTGTVDMKAMNSQVLELSTQFGVMPVDTAKAMYTTISSGFGDAASAALVLEGAMKLSRGGIADLGGSVDGLTSIMNSYGIKAEGVTAVSDAMFIAMKAGKTTIGELSSNLGKVTPLAAAAGVGLDDLLAATSALTLGGLATGEATTALRGILSGVIKPTKEASDTAKELGIDFSATAIKTMGLGNWLEMLAQKTGGDTAKMSLLFGSVEALGGVMALTGGQAGAFNSILDQMGQKAGATQEAFAKVDSSASTGFAKAAAGVEALKISIGAQLTPILSGIGDVLSGISSHFSAFAEAHPTFAKLVVVFTAVTAVVAVFGGIFLTMSGMVSAGMAAIGVAGGPLLWIIGGIIVGVTALVMAFSDGGENIAAVGQFFVDIWEGAGKTFSAVIDGIGNSLSAVGRFFVAWGQGIAAFVTAIWTGIANTFSAAWNGIASGFMAGVNAVAGFFTGIWTGVSNTVGAVWGTISGLFEAGIGAITGLWTGAWTAISDTATGIWTSIVGVFNGFVSFFTNLGTTFYNAGAGLISAIWEGIQAAWGGLVSGFEGYLSDLKAMLPFSDAKEGPLSTLTKSGKALVTTFSAGMETAGGTAYRALEGIMGNMNRLLPHSDAKEGPMSNLTASGAAVLPTFAAGMQMAPMPTMPAAPAQRSASGPSVTFQTGAFQINVSGAEGIGDLEKQLTEIFGRLALQFGDANG